MTETVKARNRLFLRLVSIAQEETVEILKAMRKKYPQLKNTKVRFQDRPDKEMIAAGAKAEIESAFVPDEREILLFLVNISSRSGNSVSDFKERFKQALLKEVGDLLGEEFLE